MKKPYKNFALLGANLLISSALTQPYAADQGRKTEPKFQDIPPMSKPNILALANNAKDKKKNNNASHTSSSSSEAAAGAATQHDLKPQDTTPSNSQDGVQPQNRQTQNNQKMSDGNINAFFRLGENAKNKKNPADAPQTSSSSSEKEEEEEEEAGSPVKPTTPQDSAPPTPKGKEKEIKDSSQSTPTASPSGTPRKNSQGTPTPSSSSTPRKNSQGTPTPSPSGTPRESSQGTPTTSLADTLGKSDSTAGTPGKNNGKNQRRRANKKTKKAANQGTPVKLQNQQGAPAQPQIDPADNNAAQNPQLTSAQPAEQAVQEEAERLRQEQEAEQAAREEERLRLAAEQAANPQPAPAQPHDPVDHNAAPQAVNPADHNVAPQPAPAQPHDPVNNNAVSNQQSDDYPFADMDENIFGNPVNPSNQQPQPTVNPVPQGTQKPQGPMATVVTIVKDPTNLQEASNAVSSPVAKEFLKAYSNVMQNQHFTDSLKKSGQFKETVDQFNVIAEAFKKSPDDATTQRYINQIEGTAASVIMNAVPLAASAIANVSSTQIAAALKTISPVATPIGFQSNRFQEAGGNLANLANSGLSAGDENNGYRTESGVFVQGFGSWESRNAQGTIAGSQASTAGATIGWLNNLSTDTVVGGSVQFVKMNTIVKGNQGKTLADSYSVSLLAGRVIDNFMVDGSITLARTSHKMHRNIDAALTGTTVQSAISKPKSWDLSGHFQLSYTVERKSLTVTPFINLQYIHSFFNGFKESGLRNTVLAREFEKFSIGTVTPKFGLIFSKTLALSNGIFTPNLSVGYKGILPVGNDTIRSKLQNMTTTIGHQGFLKKYHMATLGVGAAFIVNNDIKTTIGYEGALGRGIRSHEVVVRFTKKF